MPAIRAFLLAIVLVCAGLVAVVAAAFCRPGGRVAQALSRRVCRLMLRLLRIEVVLSGPLPRPDRPVLLAANHVSWIDPLVLGAVVPACMLAKQEVGRWPLVAAMARLQATVLVDRARRRCIPAVNATLAGRLAQGRTVLLFPEGTTHDGTRRGRFLTSHLACLRDRLQTDPGLHHAEAQAAALLYSDPQAAWIGDDTLLPHAWALLHRPPLRCTLTFAPPLVVERGFDRKALGRSLAEAVEHLLAPLAYRPVPVREDRPQAARAPTRPSQHAPASAGGDVR